MSDSPTAASLASTELIDSAHPSVVAFAREHAIGGDDRERAVALHDAVRDQFRYDPYRIDLSIEGMRASSVLARGRGWCVPKAALLAAACRVVGIPARLGYADVRNHLSTERLRRTIQTDLFIWHGYVDIWLDGAWRKATPAFNRSLVERFGLLPLAFNGRDDSIYHPFDRSGNLHMEYVSYRGTFDDMPLDRIAADITQFYPAWVQEGRDLMDADFMAEAEGENR
ncbi:MAG TPA: transglutaminase-like domain-containing protein [Burkholderiaceae bacterium]|nr:transglutaminase-like domain-containing protein [Burkholderiaceae bacterium]